MCSSSTSARAASASACSTRPAHAVAHVERELLPDTPADGIVEFDARAMADDVPRARGRCTAQGGPVDAVGISNQRGSTVVLGPRHGRARAPGIGWQDLRTIGACLALRAEGVRSSPNQSATKLQWILDQLPDRGRGRDLCFGTVDTWVAWTLSQGAVHVTDATNSAVTGLQITRAIRRPGTPPCSTCSAYRPTMLPTIVDSGRRRRRRVGVAGRAADRCAPRRPAGVARRPGLRARRATPRSPSAPAACSTSCSARRRPPSTNGSRRARSRSSPGATPGGSPGASRPSCSRPGRTCSGCATTSG